MSTTEETPNQRIITLVKGNNYDMIVPYSKNFNKIKVQCNKCQNTRSVLPKSFLKNPECSQCIKNEITENLDKNKIVEMNVELRSQAKKIGFKITEWYETKPKLVNVSCRTCHSDYTRTVRSLSNQIVCFFCKSNSQGKTSDVFDIQDLPFLINDFIIKKNDRRNLNKQELNIINSTKNQLEKRGLSIKKFDDKKDIFVLSNGKELQFSNLFVKTFVLGNSKISHNVDKLFTLEKETVSIQDFKKKYGKEYINKKILEYLKSVVLKSNNELSLFLKEIHNDSYLACIKDDNISIIDWKEPLDIKSWYCDDKELSFKFSSFRITLKITSSGKESIKNWNKLFKENWTISY